MSAVLCRRPPPKKQWPYLGCQQREGSEGSQRAGNHQGMTRPATFRRPRAAAKPPHASPVGCTPSPHQQKRYPVEWAAPSHRGGFSLGRAAGGGAGVGVCRPYREAGTGREGPGRARLASPRLTSPQGFPALRLAVRGRGGGLAEPPRRWLSLREPLPRPGRLSAGQASGPAAPRREERPSASPRCFACSWLSGVNGARRPWHRYLPRDYGPERPEALWSPAGSGRSSPLGATPLHLDVPEFLGGLMVP